MRYHYIALSQESRELSGVIEAAQEIEARAKLNELGMSVVSLTIVAEDAQLVAKHTAAGKETSAIFEFEAFDQNKKKVVGTIAAQDEFQAFIRLIEEYRLSVYYLVSSQLDIPSKKKTRLQGIGILQKQYNDYKKTIPVSTKNKTNGNSQLVEREKNNVAGIEKNKLLVTINETIDKINAFIANYGPQIKLEERDTIMSYINQLIRIKGSSNIDHIKATCEKMLSHIQKQELFINEQERIKESAHLKLETSKLLDELNASRLSKAIYINDLIEKWQKSQILPSIGNYFASWFPPLNSQMREKKTHIAAVGMNLHTYYKTLIRGSSKALRSEAWEAIKLLRAQKKRLQLEYNALVSEERRIIDAHSSVKTLQSSAFFGSLVGFLISFYLIAYYISYFFTVKKTSWLPFLPDNFFFYQTSYIKAITLLLFLMYAIKSFFRQHDDYNDPILKTVAYTISFISFMFIAVNLF